MQKVPTQWGATDQHAFIVSVNCFRSIDRYGVHITPGSNPAGYFAYHLEVQRGAHSRRCRTVIAQVGGTIVIGGTFTQIRGHPDQETPRGRVAAFDAVTGRVSTTFNPVFNGQVEQFLASGDGSSVLVGEFTTMNGADARATQ